MIYTAHIKGQYIGKVYPYVIPGTDINTLIAISIRGGQKICNDLGNAMGYLQYEYKKHSDSVTAMHVAPHGWIVVNA